MMTSLAYYCGSQAISAVDRAFNLRLLARRANSLDLLIRLDDNA